MLDRHVRSIVNQEPRLLRILFTHQIDPSTDLAELVEDASDGTLSGGESALAFCLLHLLDAPAISQSFGECFERLEGEDRAVILTILSRYDAEAATRERAGAELLRRAAQVQE